MDGGAKSAEDLAALPLRMTGFTQKSISSHVPVPHSPQDVAPGFIPRWLRCAARSWPCADASCWGLGGIESLYLLAQSHSTGRTVARRMIPSGMSLTHRVFWHERDVIPVSPWSLRRRSTSRSPILLVSLPHLGGECHRLSQPRTRRQPRAPWPLAGS